MALIDGVRKPRTENTTPLIQALAKPNSYGDAAAASANPGVAQVPTGGMKAPAPDGSQSNPLNNEVGRNALNTLNALPGVGGLASRAGGGAAQAAGRALSTERALPAAWEVVQEGGALARSGGGAAQQLGQIAGGRGDAVARAASFAPQTQPAGLPGHAAQALSAPSQGGQLAQRASAQVGEAATGFAPRAASATQWADVVQPAALAAPQAAQSAAAAASAGAPGAGRYAAGAGLGAAALLAGSANPGVTPPPAPGLLAQQPAAAPKPNFFPGNSPDAGAAIYDGVGFGKSQPAPPAAPAQPDLSAQIPGQSARAPAPDGSQADAWNTDLGRNVRSTAMAVPGAAGVGGIAATGGLISRGLSALAQGARVAGAAAGIDAAQDAAQRQPPSTLPAPGLLGAQADGAPAVGQPSAQPAGAEMGPPTEVRRVIGGGIDAVERPGHSTLYTDNKDPMMAGFLGRAAGGPSKEVTSIMQRMSDQSDAQRANRFQKQANDAQYAREVQQAQAINAAGGENARNVQNRMDQEKYLRNLDVKASSITGTRKERMAARQAHNEALKEDASVRQGTDAGSVARTQADTVRYGYDTGAATSRHNADRQAAQFGQTQGVALSRLAMEQQTAGYQNRAAAQSEQLRDVLLDPNATPEQRKVAQRSMAALSGKTAADRMQTVNLPDTTTEMGGVVRGGQALVRTLEDGTVEQVPIGERKLLKETPETTAIRNNANMTREQKVAALEKLNY